MQSNFEKWETLHCTWGNAHTKYFITILTLLKITKYCTIMLSREMHLDCAHIIFKKYIHVHILMYYELLIFQMNLKMSSRKQLSSTK